MTTTENFLRELIKEQQEIAAQWNGKESGRQEDESTRAEEAVEKIEELLEILND